MILRTLSSLAVLLRINWTTLRYVVATLVSAKRKRLKRQAADPILYDWSRDLLALLKVRVRIENPFGVELTPGHPWVVMSNHRSYYDIPLLFMAFPHGLRMVAKAELFKLPIWKVGLEAGEFIKVDRKNPAGVAASIKEATVRMESGIAVMIFPEGTRARGNAMLPLKKGGFMMAQQREHPLCRLASGAQGWSCLRTSFSSTGIRKWNCTSDVPWTHRVTPPGSGWT